MKIKSICCDYEFDVKYVSKDSLGYCTSCPCCHGSFDVDMKMLTLTEFHALKKGDKIFVRIHDTLVESKVLNKPFYNSDSDNPDWEVETSNGFCDIHSLYKLNNIIEKGNNNMFILEAAYDVYKQDWINTHTTPQMRLNAARDYQIYKMEELEKNNDDDIMSFEDWIFEQGYEGGILYVSFDEFIDNEFDDKEYMSELLGPCLYAEYLLTIRHANKEVK